MAGPALAYAYNYPHASTLEGTPTGANLRLATWSALGSPHPHFFEGRLRRPGRAADLLRGLVEVVQSRFYLPPAMMARILAQVDPVVTGSGDLLRFEAFSACCSTYGRVDFLPEAIDGTWHGRGTTNVDFNSPMRAALARIRDADQVHLAVGSDEVSLRKGDEAVVERKVALPVRWLKGFVEVQAFGARGLVGFDLAEGAYFHRELPFDLDKVESLEPRLVDARKLIDSSGVRIERRDSATGQVKAGVRGTDVEHLVWLGTDGDRCTCPWFAKHRNERGPCKHILAVQITLEEEGLP
jgi:predicted nucleic acid-binding Zn finger protein